MEMIVGPYDDEEGGLYELGAMLGNERRRGGLGSRKT
jgi:hypothetical protein